LKTYYYYIIIIFISFLRSNFASSGRTIPADPPLPPSAAHASSLISNAQRKAGKDPLVSRTIGDVAARACSDGSWAGLVGQLKKKRREETFDKGEREKMNQPPALLDLCIEFVGFNITTLPSAHVPVELKERMLSFLNRRSMLTEARYLRPVLAFSLSLLLVLMRVMSACGVLCACDGQTAAVAGCRPTNVGHERLPRDEQHNHRAVRVLLLLSRMRAPMLAGVIEVSTDDAARPYARCVCVCVVCSQGGQVLSRHHVHQLGPLPGDH
jgi:hypothetical protein